MLPDNEMKDEIQNEDEKELLFSDCYCCGTCGNYSQEWYDGDPCPVCGEKNLAFGFDDDTVAVPTTPIPAEVCGHHAVKSDTGICAIVACQGQVGRQMYHQESEASKEWSDNVPSPYDEIREFNPKPKEAEDDA